MCKPLFEERRSRLGDRACAGGRRDLQVSRAWLDTNRPDLAARASALTLPADGRLSGYLVTMPSLKLRKVLESIGDACPECPPKVS